MNSASIAEKLKSIELLILTLIPLLKKYATVEHEVVNAKAIALESASDGENYLCIPCFLNELGVADPSERLSASSPDGEMDQSKPQPESSSADYKHYDILGDAAQIVALSKRLSDDIEFLRSVGWTFETGERGEGSYMQRSMQRIVLDPDHMESNPVMTITHEVGHAMFDNSKDLSIRSAVNFTSRDKFVNYHLHYSLRDEGEATIYNIEIRNEIVSNNGPDIRVAGANADACVRLYNDYLIHGNREQTRNDIGVIFADDEIASGGTLTYRQKNEKFYGEQYDSRRVWWLGDGK